MDSSTLTRPLKVYLVEDSELIRQRLRQLLGMIQPVQIVGEASDSATALKGIAESGTDIAIVDLHLVNSSGLTVLKELSRCAPHVAAIVLTNSATAEFKKQCLAIGARYFFDKTREFDLVGQAIQQIADA